MPELPEVETIARTLTPLIQGCAITDVRVLLPRSVDAGSLPLHMLKGRTFATVGRRGKLALLQLTPPGGPHNAPSLPHILGVHLKMTGRLFVYDDNEPPTPHTRVIVGLRDPQGASKQLFFNDARTFGYMRLVSPQTLPQWKFYQNLGPEPLATPLPQMAARLKGRRGAVKAVLLDQTVVAGIGNIYADEALFRAGVDPRTPVPHIPPECAVRIFSAITAVLRESISQCGSSIRDYRTAQGDAGAFQNYFHVYGRAGQYCTTCHTPLQSGKVAGRTTVWCPHCQKLL